MKPNFKHAIVLGPTGCGKTYFMTEFVKTLLDEPNKQQVIVYTSADVSEWDSRCHVADNIDSLERLLNTKKLAGSYVVIDEALDFFADIKLDKHEMCDRLYRRGRHRGFKAFFMTQDFFGIPPAVRRNIKEMYVFALGSDLVAPNHIKRIFSGVDLSKFSNEVYKIWDDKKEEYINKKVGNNLEVLIKGLEQYKFLKLVHGQKVRRFKA